MASDDLMHRFLFDHTDIRGEVVTLSDSYREVLSHNPLPTVVRQLLGEFLAAASLLSSTLKFDGTLTLQARGEGPLPLIMAECTHHKGLRAIARPDPKVDFSQLKDAGIRQLLGKGVLAITIDPEKGERYQGIVPLSTRKGDADTLAGCLEHYFQQSEQLDTRFWLSADDKRATGLLLQALPQQIHATPEENQAHWETTCQLAETVKSAELLTLEHETLLYRLFHEEQVRIFEPATVRFACSCSHERSGRALQSLGEEEANRLLAEQEIITIDCQFCNQKYCFGPQDLTDLFADQPHTLH